MATDFCKDTGYLHHCMAPASVVWLLQVSVYGTAIFCYTLLHLQPLVSYRLVHGYRFLYGYQLVHDYRLFHLQSLVTYSLQAAAWQQVSVTGYCFTGYCIYSLWLATGCWMATIFCMATIATAWQQPLVGCRLLHGYRLLPSYWLLHGYMQPNFRIQIRIRLTNPCE